MKLSRPYQLAAFGLLVAAYIALRFWHLTDSCLWFDEIFSIHAAEHAWSDLLSFVALDLVHPPLFYILLKLWIGIGVESVFWLRGFAVLWSVISIFPFIALQRELKLNISTQFISLFLLTVNGSLLKYSQEVRMYSMFMCLALFSIWLFTRYFIKGKSLAALIIINVLLVYTHYFGWCVLMTEVAAILFFQRIKWRPVLMMFGITLASFIPWAIAVYRASHLSEGLSQNIGNTLRPGIIDLIKLKLNLIGPFYYSATTVDPLSVYRVSIPILLIAAIAFVVYFVGWKKQSDDEKRTSSLLILFTALPIVAAFAASWILPQSIWGTRHLIFVFPMVTIWIAVAITSISDLKLRAALITLLLLFNGYAFAIYAAQERPLYVWCAWGKLATENLGLSDNPQAKKQLYVFESLVAYHLWFDLRRSENVEVSVVKGIDGLIEDPGYFLPRGFDGVKTVTADQITQPSVWIAFREPNRQDYTDGRFHEPVVTLQNKGYSVVEKNSIVVGNEVAYLILLSKK